MQRWWEHFKADSGSPFHLFLKTHDITEFTFEVLEVFKPSEHDPFERESPYIQKFNSVELGLNTLNGKEWRERVVVQAPGRQEQHDRTTQDR